MKKRDRTRPRPPGLSSKEIVRRDRARAAQYRWRALPPGMSKRLTTKFERRLSEGNTVKDLTHPPSKWFMVPRSRYKKQCELDPVWAKRVLEIDAANLRRKKKTLNAKAVATKKLCLKGLHPMTGDNVYINPDGRRRCRACRKQHFGKPLSPAKIAQVKAAVEQGISLAQICNGIPMGGGPRDNSLEIVRSGSLNRLRELDPEFDRFICEHIAPAISVAQTLRHYRDLPSELKPTLVAVARLKHKLRTVRQK